MLIKSKIQKWGDSYAVKLPTNILNASGIYPNSQVSIQTGNGCLTIQLRGKSLEGYLDEILSDIPEAKELIITAQKRLSSAIANTDETIKTIELMRKEFSKNK